MKKTNFQKVLEFHKIFGQPVGVTVDGGNLDEDRQDLRNGFIIEEFCELLEAQGYAPDAIKKIESAWEDTKQYRRVKKPDIVEIADALADLEYFNHGTAVEYGINLDAVFNEVHSSNLSKLDPETGLPIYREDGKVLKGSNFFKPNIAAILANQIEGELGYL